MRLAIFGGTFDPIHNAHLIVGREAAAHFSLDKVLFVTASQPPHKSGTGTSFDDRMAMVELACAGEPHFEASRIEAGNRKSYSFDTIERVKAKLALDDRLFFLIGADAFAEIGTWYRALQVIESVEFIVVTRPGHTYATPSGARVHRLNTLALPVSSSEIREKLAAGEPVHELPPPVLDYIHERGLYAVR
ncbi:MAG: nicotinate-nucleotide adenylyltransferase [Bryobacteraceae bacterium]